MVLIKKRVYMKTFPDGLYLLNVVFGYTFWAFIRLSPQFVPYFVLALVVTFELYYLNYTKISILYSFFGFIIDISNYFTVS